MTGKSHRWVQGQDLKLDALKAELWALNPRRKFSAHIGGQVAYLLFITMTLWVNEVKVKENMEMN